MSNIGGGWSPPPPPPQLRSYAPAITRGTAKRMAYMDIFVQNFDKSNIRK